jgi:hypothetical protein
MRIFAASLNPGQQLIWLPSKHKYRILTQHQPALLNLSDIQAGADATMTDS